jgi:hypothetical protein
MAEDAESGQVNQQRQREAVTPAPPDNGPARPHPPVNDDLTSKVIPYRNPQALIAYYVSIVSLIPCVALLAGPAAFVLGVLGLKAAARQPAAHGRVHAWIGIVLGALTFAANTGFIALMAATGGF